MLEIIRQRKQSIVIKIVFIIIVLSFIGTMFLVWGKGSDGSGGSRGYAAKVNGTKISVEEYQSAYQRIRNMYQQIYGQSIPAEMEKMLNLKKVALDSLIDNMLVMKEAKKMGIKVSKDEVAKEIAGMSTFQKDGAFNFDLYQQLLRSNRMTPKEFEESQKNELMIKKARQSVKDKATVTDDEALAQYKKENDKLDLEFVAFAPSDVIDQIKPTEAELKDYLQKNQNEFKTPVKVALSYVLIDPASMAAKLSVSDEEIQTFYQKNIDRWQGKDGILPFNEVKDKVRAEALKQKAAKQAYELASDTLYKNAKSGDLSLIARQLDLKVQDTSLFSVATPPSALNGEAAVIKKALELKQGELGGPVETAKGIYILKAKERKEAVVPPLAEIKSEVEQKTRTAKSVDLAKQKAEEAAKQLAAKAPAKTQSTGSFGYSVKGDIPVIGNSPELMEAAFKLTSAAPAAPAPLKVGNRWYAIRLKARTEAPRSEFDKNKEQLKKTMLPKKQEEALAAWVKDLKAKATIEVNPALVAEK
ncbi:peptidylprolyl isomerase [Pelotalea chapellei]|uniref:Periplasmic chaperone PpiD n=1 Tax=Pelotalea chapellei TaxID=44671 RepID=A0ABS5UC46_9BACT|nr:peptidylprolyl isomerase [Pelotalea chapellei]MBT1073263.1 SurA N-terminal domain-containing protein [Pelotalea chapellei]